MQVKDIFKISQTKDTSTMFRKHHKNCIIKQWEIRRNRDGKVSVLLRNNCVNRYHLVILTNWDTNINGK